MFAKNRRVLNRKQLPFNTLFPTRPGACAFCKCGLSGKQKRWCSDSCGRHAWWYLNLRRGVPRFIRKAVEKRDKGICAHCKADCVLIEKIYWHAVRSFTSGRYWYKWVDIDTIWPVRGPGNTFWQADHIIELRDGGQHLFKNLQTLCTICHKAKTRTRI
jgi:5-methylcytosine-specific restriction endonuclease McrA